MSSLEGKRALIVGASRGIGAATAEALAAAGMGVALVARSEAAIATLARELGQSGATAHAYACDVADGDRVKAVVDQAAADLGGIDVVVNNAGIIDPIGHLADSDPAAWARNIQVNLIGAYHVIRHALAHLPGDGTVVNISSGAAGGPMEGWSAYCSGKAGLAMLSRAVHLELPALRIFSFRPGVVDTEMQGKIRASGMNAVSRLKREDLAPVSDPARFIVWLCGPEADDLIGQEIDIRTPELRARAGLG
ncbi:MAG: SDR family NAD(P)-dependent oxidoreductase [Azospirillaceae bacterium]